MQNHDSDYENKAENTPPTEGEGSHRPHAKTKQSTRSNPETTSPRDDPAQKRAPKQRIQA